MDVSDIANPEINYKKMHVLIEMKKAGMNVSEFVNSHIKCGELKDRLLRFYMSSEYLPGDEKQQRALKVLEPYIVSGLFTTLKLYQIYLGAYDDVDVSFYADKKYSWDQMKVLRTCLNDGYDASVLADEGFTAYRMEIILHAMRRGLDTRYVTDLRFDNDQAKELLYAQQNDLDCEKFADPSISAYRMKSIRMCEIALKSDEDCKVVMTNKEIKVKDRASGEVVGSTSLPPVEGGTTKALNAF